MTASSYIQNLLPQKKLYSKINCNLQGVPSKSPKWLMAQWFVRSHTVPVWIFNDAPIDPLLKYFKVGNTGCFGQIEAELLSLAVSGVIECAIMKQAEGRATHTLTLVNGSGYVKDKEENALAYQQ